VYSLVTTLHFDSLLSVRGLRLRLERVSFNSVNPKLVLSLSNPSVEKLHAYTNDCHHSCRNSFRLLDVWVCSSPLATALLFVSPCALDYDFRYRSTTFHQSWLHDTAGQIISSAMVYCCDQHDQWSVDTGPMAERILDDSTTGMKLHVSTLRPSMWLRSSSAHLIAMLSDILRFWCALRTRQAIHIHLHWPIAQQRNLHHSNHSVRGHWS
jgi:hypothetical protein